MIIGILSDTHGRSDAMAAAVRTLRAAGAEFFLHCGDIGPEAMLDSLAGLPSAIVWGNNDWDRLSLARYAQTLGIACGGDTYHLALDGKEIGLTHGDDDTTVRRLLGEQTLDYLFTGHSHQPHDRREGRTRWINPGALYRARLKTVATLDLAADRLNLLTVNV